MTIRLHRGDLPDLKRYTGAVAIDTEAMGLDPHRDRLCVVQLSPGDGNADPGQKQPHAGMQHLNIGVQIIGARDFIHRFFAEQVLFHPGIPLI